MKRRALKVALGLLALCCTLLTSMPVLAVVNGEPDDGHKPMFPNVGAIVMTKTTDALPIIAETPQAISSGTLVSPHVLLTAGHTVAFMQRLMDDGGLTLADFGVSFKFNAHDDSKPYIGIAAIMTHEQFIAVSGLREPEVGLDVGVVILEKAVHVKAVTRARVGLLDDSELLRQETPFVVVGYGATLPSEFPPPQIAVFPLPEGERRWAVSTFQALRHHYLLLSQNLAQGEGGMSNGDSGGPAFLMDGDGGLVQVGIFSNRDSADASLGVFCRTDLPEVVEFVEAVIDAVDGR